jgi:acetoin:2,6-dichlorophenolindophenol oxidoreductase subunit beta
MTEEIVKYREALFECMDGAMAGNDDAFIIGQGVDDHKGIFGTTLGLAEKYGAGRVMDTPLAEEAITGISVGASLNGMYPIMTHIRADFMLLATNQIINLVAKYRYMFGGLFKVPMLIRAVVGRSWGQGAQHTQSLQSLFAHIPGLTVIMPSDSSAILSAYPHVINHLEAPVISFEHRLLYELDFTIDRQQIAAISNPLTSRLKRTGSDVTVVATSIMVLEAERAAEHLATAGIECDVIDLNCISNPDTAMIISSVEKTGRLLIADTSWQAYGVAAEICRIICEQAPSALQAPVVTMGMSPAPCPTAKTLEDLYYPDLHDLCDAIGRLVSGSDQHGIDLPEKKPMTDTYKHFRGPF